MVFNNAIKTAIAPPMQQLGLAQAPALAPQAAAQVVRPRGGVMGQALAPALGQAGALLQAGTQAMAKPVVQPMLQPSAPAVMGQAQLQRPGAAQMRVGIPASRLTFGPGMA